MDDMSVVYEWAKTNPINEEQVQYATILALKILDDSCKMDMDNYNLFMAVYDGINDKVPTPLDKKVHKIVELSRCDDPIIPKQEYKEVIHNLRVAMMKDMDKSKMKSYKKTIWDILE
ncbi:MAG: hypothetical protein U9Q30_03750 [Campylobacterota bacterium]|nr:hypothetical protein [Campylobacterota bacterium]